MTDTTCPAGVDIFFLLRIDSIPSLQEVQIDYHKINERAFSIWKRYGNNDAVTSLCILHLDRELLPRREGTSYGNSVKGGIRLVRRG